MINAKNWVNGKFTYYFFVVGATAQACHPTQRPWSVTTLIFLISFKQKVLIKTGYSKVLTIIKNQCLPKHHVSKLLAK